MKKLLLHIALLSYTVVMFKPVLPYVNDLVSHILFYTHHMATVHYEHGKYHVHYETAKDAGDEQQGKSTVPVLKKDNLSGEYLATSLVHFDLYTPDHVNQHNFSATAAVVSGSVNKHFPPPKA